MQNTSEEKQSILPLPVSETVQNPIKKLETTSLPGAENSSISLKTETKGQQVLPTQKLESKVESKVQAKSTQIKLEPRIEPVRDIVRASDKANRKDIEWLAKFLREQRRLQSTTLNATTFLGVLRKKLMADRDAIAKAKVLWLDKSERQLYWLNLRRLTNDPPFWGHYESAIQMLDNHKKLPFEFLGPISGCQNEFPLSSVGEYFENARMGRIYTVYKLVMIYAVFVAATHNEPTGGKTPRQLREHLHLTILANAQYVYPIEVPAVLNSLLSECWLYRVTKTANVMLFPNCGYVFGGLVQPEAPHNRGLDCTSFMGWISGCGRPLTMLYEVAWNLNRGKPAGRVITDEIDKKAVQLFRERHKMVDARGSDMLPGDILVWRHADGSGHAMLVQRVVGEDHIITVECTNYKNGSYEGFQERMVTICDPREGGRALVMRPLNQDVYYNYLSRSSAMIADLKPNSFKILEK